MKKPEKTTSSIWVLLNLVHRQLTQKFESELKKANLPTARWYDILWALERHPDGLRQFELEERSLFDQPNLSRVLKKMVQDGLIEQIVSPEDGRGRILMITDAGKDLRKNMWRIYGGLMISEIENTVPADLTQDLVDGLSSMLSNETETMHRTVRQNRSL